ncbi:hypothetical protein [Caballeronia temeraria]|nr:hypothetical protein [Caballeronia temeraria]
MDDDDNLLRVEIRAQRLADGAYVVHVGDGEVSVPRRFASLDDAGREIAQSAIETSQKAGRWFDFRFAIGIEDDDDERTLAAGLGHSIAAHLSDLRRQLMETSKP